MLLGTLRISITRVADEKTVEFDYPWEVHDDTLQDWTEWQGTAIFLWGEGNYSCNCNRFLFFHRALGLSEQEIDAIDPDKDDVGSCGAYEHFRVNWIRNETGAVIYEEK